jgi:cell wall-associated NlpC family hydrolase
VFNKNYLWGKMFMKKKFNKIFKSLIISSACISMINVTIFADAVGTVKETIKLRSNPFDVGKQISVLYAGDTVQVVDNKQGWYKVCKNGTVLGWASGQYITLKGTISNSNTKTTATTQKTTNVAQKPTTSKPTSSVAVKVQTPVKKTVNVAYVSPKTAVVNISANVRKSPTTSSSILTSANPGIGFYVLGQSDDWYKVKLANSTIGYIKTSYVSFASVKVSRGVDYNTAAAKTADAKTTAPQTVAPAQQNTQSKATVAQAETSYYASRVLYAKSFLGTPYVYGANGPSAFDCSGFTKYVCAHFGVNLSRTAAEQAAQGTFVQKSDLQPGDLVFFDTSGQNTGNINHAGMYIGDGQFINASSGGGRVMISDITSGFYAGAYVTGRRVN